MPLQAPQPLKAYPPGCPIHKKDIHKPIVPVDAENPHLISARANSTSRRHLPSLVPTSPNAMPSGSFARLLLPDNKSLRLLSSGHRATYQTARAAALKAMLPMILWLALCDWDLFRCVTAMTAIPFFSASLANRARTLRVSALLCESTLPKKAEIGSMTSSWVSPCLLIVDCSPGRKQPA